MALWYNPVTLQPERSTGGGFFHGNGTWGCAARKGTLFWTSSLAKGMRLDNVSLGKGMLFGNFGQRLVKFW